MYRKEGNNLYTEKDIINDVLLKDREAEKIFKKFGIRCFGWGGALYKSIGYACEIYNVDSEKLLKELNNRGK